MQLLLDTHALLWWLEDAAELTAEARDAIGDPANTVWLSAVVVWEMRIKQAIGKLELPDDFQEVLAREGFEELAVAVRHTHRLATLPDLHRDPFDRLLVAQALDEELTLVTRDARIERYEVPILRA